MVRDPLLDTAYQDLENLRNNLQQAQEKLFDVGVYLAIYGETTEEMDRAESDISGILEPVVYTQAGTVSTRAGIPNSCLPLGPMNSRQFKIKFFAAFVNFPVHLIRLHQ